MESLLALFTMIIVLPSPFWLPLAFLSYAIGRRQFDLKFLFVFVTAESVGIGFCSIAFSNVIPSHAIHQTFLLSLAVSSPFWFPIVGIAFAVGRPFYHPLYLTLLVVAELTIILLLCGGTVYWALDWA